MSSPTGRRLELLSLLQAHPGSTAAQLARRLGTTERTLRRDVVHLRELGYRIDGEPGRAGGYTLASGGTMPPLVLDADEALVVALGLRAQVRDDGLGPAAVTALAKLSETVPSRLRSRMRAVAETETATGTRTPSAAVLVPLALACRNGEAVRLRHGEGGRTRPRDVQPHRLVLVRSRWYLLGCERGADRWRTYALERISDVRPLGSRLRTPPPPDDAAAFVVRSLAHGRRHLVRVRTFTSADLVRELVPPSVGDVEPDGDDCVVTLHTDDLDWAARWLVARDLDVDVLEPPALADRLAALGRYLAERYGSAP